MNGGTFREWIDSNKAKALEFLKGKDFQATDEIYYGYKGEKDIYQVRKAMRELLADDKVYVEKRGLNSNYWKIKEQPNL